METVLTFTKFSAFGKVLNPAVCGPKLLGVVTLESGRSELVVFTDFDEAARCVADAASGMTAMTSCTLFAKVPT